MTVKMYQCIADSKPRVPQSQFVVLPSNNLEIIIPRARIMNASNKNCSMGYLTMGAHFQPTSQYRKTLTLITLIHTTKHYMHYQVIKQENGAHQPSWPLLTFSASAYSHAIQFLPPGSTLHPEYQPNHFFSQFDF